MNIKDPIVIRKDGIRVLVFLIETGENPLRITIARNTVFSQEEIQRIKMFLSQSPWVTQVLMDIGFQEIPEFKPTKKGEPYEFIYRNQVPSHKVLRPLSLVNLGQDSIDATDAWLKYYTGMVGDRNNTLALCAVSYTSDYIDTATDKARLLLKRLENEIQIKEEETL